MKSKVSLAALALLSAFSLQPSAVFGQGSLTPPGPPAPTMKSLDQVEARTAITTAGAVTISEPGSYYLTRNISVSSGDAITIVANGVTLDLNGFTISSTSAALTGSGVHLSGTLADITICNGHIRGGVTNNGSGVYSGTGFNAGIAYGGNPSANVLVSRVSVSGCANYGIYLYDGRSSVVENCTVRTVGSYGIRASTIRTCSAMDCGNSAIYGDVVSDCRGMAATTGAGVVADTALNCYGSSASGYGIFATATAIGCFGASTNGAAALSAQTASTCVGYRSGGVAIQATVANGCYALAGINNIVNKYNMP
jgi:parallel beta-helix repeat protein